VTRVEPDPYAPATPRSEHRPLRVFTPAGAVGGVEEVGRRAHEALTGVSPGAELHVGPRAIMTSPRPQAPWMALTWKAHALVRVVHPFLRGPSAVWLHGAEMTRDRDPLHRWQRSRSFGPGTLLLAVSPMAARLLPPAVQERVRLIGPPIPAAASPARPEPGSEPESDGLVRLLSIGRAIPRKGHDTAIAVAQALAAQRPVALELVGPGPDLPRLRLLARDASGPGLQVTVHGEVSPERRSALYSAADALLFLPRSEAGEYEGLGLVSLEAAAHGCPSVVLDCGGSRYGIAQGVSGLVLPAGASAQELATAVLRVVDRPGVRQAAERYAAQFSLPLWQERVRAVMAGEPVEWAWPTRG
jgi:glycosyltransferase involved in cell wall biosynthesis